MEHRRPNGLAQGYFCGRCGQPAGMLGHKSCQPNPELVRELERLNSKENEK